MKRSLIVVVAAAAASLGGCAHYAVTDLETDRTYYTRTLKRTMDGDVRFRDAETRTIVKLDSYEAVKISPAEYRRQVDTTPTTRRAAR